MSANSAAQDFDLVRRECGTAPGGTRPSQPRVGSGERKPVRDLVAEQGWCNTDAQMADTSPALFLDSPREASGLFLEMAQLEKTAFDDDDDVAAARRCDASWHSTQGMNLSPRGSFDRRNKKDSRGQGSREPESAMLKGLLNSAEMEVRARASLSPSPRSPARSPLCPARPPCEDHR